MRRRGPPSFRGPSARTPARWMDGAARAARRCAAHAPHLHLPRKPARHAPAAPTPAAHLARRRAAVDARKRRRAGVAAAHRLGRWPGPGALPRQRKVRRHAWRVGRHDAALSQRPCRAGARLVHGAAAAGRARWRVVAGARAFRRALGAGTHRRAGRCRLAPGAFHGVRTARRRWQLRAAGAAHRRDRPAKRLAAAGRGGARAGGRSGSTAAPVRGHGCAGRRRPGAAPGHRALRHRPQRREDEAQAEPGRRGHGGRAPPGPRQVPGPARRARGAHPGRPAVPDRQRPERRAAARAAAARPRDHLPLPAISPAPERRASRASCACTMRYKRSA